MRFEFTFNEEIYRKQSNNYFTFVWKKFQLKNNKRFYIIVPYVLLGAFIIFLKSNLGYIFLFVSFYNLYQYFKFDQHYKTNRKNYLSKVEKNILDQSSQNKISVWEFKDDKFYYSDYNFEIDMKWNLFSNIEAKEKVLVVFQLNKQEVGETEFNKIVLFLESKISKV